MDSDIDGDGVPNEDDAYPMDASKWEPEAEATEDDGGTDSDTGARPTGPTEGGPRDLRPSDDADGDTEECVEKRGLFGWGKVGPVDTGYIVISAIVISVLIVLLILMLIRRRRKRDELQSDAVVYPSAPGEPHNEPYQYQYQQDQRVQQTQYPQYSQYDQYTQSLYSHTQQSGFLDYPTSPPNQSLPTTDTYPQMQGTPEHQCLPPAPTYLEGYAYQYSEHPYRQQPQQQNEPN
jgi:hypothetical protein